MATADNVLDQIDTKLDELDVLIADLPVKTKVQNELRNVLYALYEEIEQALEEA